MYIKNRYISLAYKIIAVIFCIAGQILTLGIPNGKFEAGQFLYYTNQSNILCLVYFVGAAIFVFKKIKTDGPQGPATFAPRFKGAVLMAITVTFLIFWFVLNSRDFTMDTSVLKDGVDLDFDFDNSLWPITNKIVHMIVPLLTIFDWLLFDTKGHFQKFDPIIWLIIPLAYYLFSLVVASTGYTFWTGSHYPYFFIDSEALGWGVVSLYIVSLGLGFLMLGYIFYGLDKVLAKKHH